MSDDAIKLFLAEDYILAGRKRPTRKEARASLDSLQARLTATEAEAERRRIGAKARIDDLSARLQAAEAERDKARNILEGLYPADHESQLAAQIAKGLQLAAQLDEDRAHLSEVLFQRAEYHRQLDQARALLREVFEQDALDTDSALLAKLRNFLQPSNEEGPQPLRPNSTVKSI